MESGLAVLLEVSVVSFRTPIAGARVAPGPSFKHSAAESPASRDLQEHHLHQPHHKVLQGGVMSETEPTGRAIIQIPLRDLVEFVRNDSKGIMEIVLEGDQYPRWHIGAEPVVIIGASFLLSHTSISEFARMTNRGEL